MIPDVNLLLYAYDSTSVHHRAAAAWWTACLNGAEPVGIPRVVLFGFVRLATSARVFAAPMSIDEAAACGLAWLERPHVVDLDGGPQHPQRALKLLKDAGTAGNLVTDAQIAAIAVEQRATLCSNDADFARFPGLTVENPLRS